MEQAIKKSIEGGYNGYPKPFCMECGGYQSPNGQPSMFLDPLFWQCLGKAMGWNEEKISYKVPRRKVVTYRGTFVRPAHTVTRKRYNRGTNKAWVHHWHRFIDWLAEGKDANSFFEELLTSNIGK